MKTPSLTRECGLPLVLAGALALAAMADAAVAQILGSPAPSSAVQGGASAVDVLRPSQAEMEKSLAALSLTPRGAFVAKKKHQEVMATTKEGRLVMVKFDWAGRVKSVSDPNHRKSGTLAPSQQQISTSVREAGFEPLGLVETKKHHVVMRARNQQGEMLNLHVDFNGVIYKQDWLR